MKLLSVILFFTLAAVSFAQIVQVGYPPAGADITAGNPFTVQIQRPVRVSPSNVLS